MSWENFGYPDDTEDEWEVEDVCASLGAGDIGKRGFWPNTWMFGNRRVTETWKSAISTWVWSSSLFCLMFQLLTSQSLVVNGYFTVVPTHTVLSSSPGNACFV
jgi:hypothetical protein